MSWFSLLPAHLTVLETWIIRFFLLLTLLTIGPWALFLAYDMLLYLLRATLYEIPFVGGRARGRRRPSKPTLETRPNGQRRTFSFGPGAGGGGEDDTAGMSGAAAEWDRGAVLAEGRRRKRREDGDLGDGDGVDIAVGD